MKPAMAATPRFNFMSCLRLSINDFISFSS